MQQDGCPHLQSTCYILFLLHAAASSWGSAGHGDGQLRAAAAVPAAAQVKQGPRHLPQQFRC